MRNSEKMGPYSLCPKGSLFELSYLQPSHQIPQHSLKRIFGHWFLFSKNWLQAPSITFKVWPNLVSKSFNQYNFVVTSGPIRRFQFESKSNRHRSFITFPALILTLCHKIINDLISEFELSHIGIYWALHFLTFVLSSDLPSSSPSWDCWRNWVWMII